MYQPRSLLFHGNPESHQSEEASLPAGHFDFDLDFPVRCAQNCWDNFRRDSSCDPLLSLFEALKWCFRFGCHAGIAFLEHSNP